MWLKRRINYLHQHRVQHVLLSCCQSVFLQPQDELRPLVRPQSQQVCYPLPERPLLHVTHAPPVWSTGALLWLGHANPPLNFTQERLGRVSGLGQAGQRGGRGSHRHFLACREHEISHQKQHLPYKVKLCSSLALVFIIKRWVALWCRFCF